MNTTHAPVRDQLITSAEGILAEAWDALARSCPDCHGSLTGWCDPCGEAQAQVDEITPILFRLYAAGTDGEARTVVAGLPALAPAVSQQAVA